MASKLRAFSLIALISGSFLDLTGRQIVDRLAIRHHSYSAPPQGVAAYSTDKESTMMRMESRFAFYCFPDHTAPSNGAALNEPFSGYDREPRHEPLPLGEDSGSALPGWDSLWIDLGGEG
jgi:hypothetical protein